jgi:cyclase
MKPLFASLIIALVIPGISNAQNATLDVTNLTESIYMLSGKGGGNIGVMVGQDGTVLIDNQLKQIAPALKETIAEIGGNNPRFILNTHYHPDHVGGNKAYDNTNTAIVSHDNTRSRLAKTTVIKAFNVKNAPYPTTALPNVTYSDAMTFQMNGETLRVVHFPNAHTDGDSVVYFEDANVVHTGDLFFNGMYPFIDVDNGGDIIGLIAAVQELIATTDENTKIIPGHGPLASRADLIAFQDMLTFSNASVRDLKKEGKSVEQAIAADPLVDYDTKWGGGIFSTAKWLELLYTAP